MHHRTSIHRLLAAASCVPLCAGLAQSQPCTSPTALLRGPLASAPVLWPQNVMFPSLAYDTNEGLVVMVGVSAALDATVVWEWDGFAWEERFPADGIAPPPLFEPAVVYHQGSGRLVVFGGRLSTGSASSQTWLWDGYFWSTPRLGGGTPPARWGAGAVCLPGNDAVLMFGGVDESGGSPSGAWGWYVTGPLRGWHPADVSTLPRPAATRARNNVVYQPNTYEFLYCDPRSVAQGGSGVWRWQYTLQGSPWQQLSIVAAPGSGTGLDFPLIYDADAYTVVRLGAAGADAGTQR